MADDNNAGCLLTVVILTLNEARNIERCIASAGIADEVLVVDSESVDDTCRIAERLGARVVTSPWPGCYAEQRNRADGYVRTDWILQLDADETISTELANELAAFFAEGGVSRHAAGRIPRKELVFGRWIEHGGWYPQFKLRLYRKGAGQWTGRVHEGYNGYHGEPHTFTGPILHHSDCDVRTFVDKFNRYSSLDAEQAFSSGKRFSMFRLFFQPLERFFARFIVHKGYRDGFPGLVLAFMIAFNYVLIYLKLWELEYPRKEVQG